MDSYGINPLSIGFLWIPMIQYDFNRNPEGFQSDSYGSLWISVGFLWIPVASCGIQ